MTDRERDRGILSKADRNYVRAAEGEYSRQASHERERAIRERVVDSLLDFTVLFEHMTPEERAGILEELPDGEEGTDALAAALSLLYEAAGQQDSFPALLERAIRESIEQDSEPAPPGQMLSVDTSLEVDIGYEPSEGPEVNAAMRTLLSGGSFEDLDREQLLDYLQWAERAGSVAPEAVVRERREFFEDVLDGPPPDDVDVDDVDQ